MIETNGFHIEEENERFSVVVRVVARSSTLKISGRPLADYVKINYQRAYRSFIFPQSTSHGSDFCRCLCRRGFLNSY